MTYRVFWAKPRGQGIAWRDYASYDDAVTHARSLSTENQPFIFAEDDNGRLKIVWRNGIEIN